jgi:hypothetical protein
MGDLELGFGDSRFGTADDGGKAAGKFANAIGLVEQHGFAGDNFLANAESADASEKIKGSVLLSDATTSDERNIRERPLQGPNIIITAHHRAGKNLHKIGAGFPCGQNFGRRERSSHHDDVGIFGDELHSGNIESRAADKLSARIDTVLGGIGVEHGAGTQNETGNFLGEIPNDIDGTRDSHGDFDDGDAAVANFVDGKTGVVGGGGANDRNDTDFMDLVTQLLFVHEGNLLDAGQDSRLEAERPVCTAL